MTKKTSKKSAKVTTEASAQIATRRENIRWMSGFMVLVMGLFMVCSIVSFFFYWREDMSAMDFSSNPQYNPIYNNVCGYLGAKVSMLMVGRGFGVFALIIPLYLLIIGWRLFRSHRLRLVYITVSSSLILILGSLTLAYIFDTRWELYGSGLGGGFGLELCHYLEGLIGSIGTLLSIIALWILTGLFINRNFLRAVDSAGEHVAGGITGAASWVWGKVRRERVVGEEPELDERVESSPVVEASVLQNSAPQQPVTPVEQPLVSPASPFAAVERTAKVEVDAEGNVRLAGNQPSQPANDARVDDYPFKEPTAPIEEPSAMGYVQPNEPQSEPSEELEPQNNSVFTTVPLTPQPSEPEEEFKDEGIIITVEQPKPKIIDDEKIEIELYDPLRDLYSYEPPMPSLLKEYKNVESNNEHEIFENKERIRETLLNFGIPIRSMHATVGPTVTLYEIVQEQGVKISKIQNLENDIAQSLKALGIRIIAPIPGRGTIGIEVPNITKQTVSMHSAICSREFQESKAQLPVVIGRTIQNQNYTFDLAKMPHLLVAGATGQGKSVGLNAIITSLLYRKHPAELKFVLIDPKMVEFSLFNKLEKHFLAKMESEDEAIVTDPRKAVYTLNSLCAEMENRLELCKQAHARNIVEYNDKFTQRSLNPEHGHRFMPYIVVVIDEFADLIMTAKEVEAPVMRLAQKARAVGIHLIVATQRPDVRVITGGIKANFPARIAFRVMQMTDSRTIIDQPGANQLIGRGDMLLSNGGELTRIQCAFVDTPEVERIVDHIGRQQGYPAAYALPDYTPEQGAGEASVSFGSEESGAPQKYDPKFGEIAREAVTSGVISTSMIQRNFEVGFNRAGRIMLQLERAGIVGPQIGSKPREIKYYDLQSLEARLQELGVY